MKDEKFFFLTVQMKNTMFGSVYSVYCFRCGVIGMEMRNGEEQSYTELKQEHKSPNMKIT